MAEKQPHRFGGNSTDIEKTQEKRKKKCPDIELGLIPKQGYANRELRSYSMNSNNAYQIQCYHTHSDIMNSDCNFRMTDDSNQQMLEDTRDNCIEPPKGKSYLNALYNMLPNISTWICPGNTPHDSKHYENYHTSSAPHDSKHCSKSHTSSAPHDSKHCSKSHTFSATHDSKHCGKYHTSPAPKEYKPIIIQEEVNADKNLFKLMHEYHTRVGDQIGFIRVKNNWWESHLKLEHGLNILATCLNDKCKLRFEGIVCPRGNFMNRNGYCNLDMEVFKVSCPRCKQRITQNESFGFGFYECGFRLNYRLTNQQEYQMEMEGNPTTFYFGKLCSFKERFLFLEAQILGLRKVKMPKEMLFNSLASTDITNKSGYKRIKVDWTDAHLQVVPGVNFIVICKNDQCNFYFQNVICPSGLYPERKGHCPIDRETFLIKCPICKLPIKHGAPIGIGFYKCAFQVSYKLRDRNSRLLALSAAGDILLYAKLGKANNELFQYIDINVGVRRNWD